METEEIQSSQVTQPDIDTQKTQEQSPVLVSDENNVLNVQKGEKEKLDFLMQAEFKRQQEKGKEEIIGYCKNRDPDFNYELTQKVFDEMSVTNPVLAEKYGTSEVGALAFWYDFVKNSQDAFESKKPMMPSKLKGLEEKLKDGGLSVDEQMEYLKYMNEGY